MGERCWPLQGAAELRSSAPLMLEVSADMAREEQQVGHHPHEMAGVFSMSAAVTLPTPPSGTGTRRACLL
jgi:hypothetical protein